MSFSTSEIDVHIRTYRSLLKASGKIKISQLTDSHLSLQPLLHAQGNDGFDTAAFIYVILRLPSCIFKVENIILGQSHNVFVKNGLRNFSSFKEVASPGRRRKMFYDGKKTLAVYIASVSDVDDIITILTTLEIEWNKLHEKLKTVKNLNEKLKEILSAEDFSKIQNILGKNFSKALSEVAEKQANFTVELFSGSYVEYAKSTKSWWENIDRKLHFLKLHRRPIYFVSSNTHAMANLLTDWVKTDWELLVSYLYKTRNENLINIWNDIVAKKSPIHREYFLFYIAKKYLKNHQYYLKKRDIIEKQSGIHRILPSHYLDIEAQIIEINKLSHSDILTRLNINKDKITQSDAIIVNIDYPLGWAAYQVLTEIGQSTENIRGVYIMGKAATLNANIGDILIPSTVFDQHTKNIYVFSNTIRKSDFDKIFQTGLVLDNLKTATVKGTFLENKKLIGEWYKEGYSAIEMEAGPYLNAVYEFVYYNRYTEDEFINLTQTPFDLGIVHYASDTPHSKAKNLGVRNLSYEGIEPTYAISEVILKKIFDKETE